MLFITFITTTMHVDQDDIQIKRIYAEENKITVLLLLLFIGNLFIRFT